MVVLLSGLLTLPSAGWTGQGRDDQDGQDSSSGFSGVGFLGDAPRIVRGFQVAPVPLTLRGKNRALVGLGSYLVNAQGGCNDCHTFPPYKEGGNPFQGQPEIINTDRYLGGGAPFGPNLVSANITPDEYGRPAGLTREAFKQALRTGHDPDHPDQLLQVMPWPVYGKMTDADLNAIYEYLSAIPHVDSTPPSTP
jgi:hypothetical protein